MDDEGEGRRVDVFEERLRPCGNFSEEPRKRKMGRHRASPAEAVGLAALALGIGVVAHGAVARLAAGGVDFDLDAGDSWRRLEEEEAAAAATLACVSAASSSRRPVGFQIASRGVFPSVPASQADRERCG